MTLAARFTIFVSSHVGNLLFPHVPYITGMHGAGVENLQPIQTVIGIQIAASVFSAATWKWLSQTNQPTKT